MTVSLRMRGGDGDGCRRDLVAQRRVPRQIGVVNNPKGPAPMPNSATPPAGASKFLIALAGGTVAGWMFLGLPWALVWLCGCFTYAIWQWRAWVAVVFAVLWGALLFGPGLMDRRALERQVAAIDAQEMSVAPLDLSGARVLFVGGTRYLPWDCSDLCRALVEADVAEAIYFGHDRSLDLRFGNGPIDLTTREIHSFPRPLVPGLPEDTRSVPVEMGQVDYVVLENPSLTRASLAAMIPDVPSFGGLYPTHTLWVEYLVFEAPDLAAFDPTTLTPLISRFEYARHSQISPGLPFFPLGDIEYSHRHTPGLSQWVTANGREVAAILCGPEGRPFYHTCAVVRN